MLQERRFTLAELEASRRAGYDLGYRDGFADRSRQLDPTGSTVPGSSDREWRIQGQSDGDIRRRDKGSGGWQGND